MIDIHIIPTPGFDDNFRVMKEKLQHPLVNVITGEWIDLNLLEARWRAYNQGTSPYVSFADGDDAVLDISWLGHAMSILDNHPHVVCVYPRWKVVEADKPDRFSPIHEWSPELHRSFASQPLPHHLSIMRRSAVIELLKIARDEVGFMTKNPERYLVSGLSRYGLLVPIDDVAYEWRLRSGTARTIEDTSAVDKFLAARAMGDYLAALKVDRSRPWEITT